MADPITIMAGLGMGLSAIGGIVGAKGAKDQARAQSEMNLYQAGIAQTNAKIAMENADYQRNVGEKEAFGAGLKAKAVAGKIRAVQGASNLDVASGSNVKVQEGQELITKLDSAQIRENAARRAFGYETEAFNQEQTAGLYKRAGKNAVTAGNIAAASSIIGGAASVASKWQQASSTGIYSQGKIGYFDNGGGAAPNWRTS